MGAVRVDRSGAPLIDSDWGQGSSAVEQGLHKPCVVGSNPTPATKHARGEEIPLVFTVYVLRSLRNGRHYVGFTSRSLEERLSEHNRGFPKGWTARNRPFCLVHAEHFQTEREARARERFLKSGTGRTWLRRRLTGYPPLAGGAS